MKQYCFPLPVWFCDKNISAIRDKRSLVLLLVQTIKLMSTNRPDEGLLHNNNHVTLCISKMSRLVYDVGGQIFSFNFPFQVKSNIETGFLQFIFQDLCLVDSSLTSHLLTVINEEDVFNASNISQFESLIFEIEETSPNLWPVFHFLLTFEDGYIRYDHDQVNFDEENIHKHPVDHYDVFYSSNSTFKLGLETTISKNNFIDMLNIHSNCHYVQEK